MQKKKTTAKSTAAAVKAPVKKCAETGRVQVDFEFRDVPGRTVCIAGSFNEWHPDKVMHDKNGDGVYRCRLTLEPGEYQYKFVVDGEWRADAGNPEFVPNEFGSLNSLLKVVKK